MPKSCQSCQRIDRSPFVRSYANCMCVSRAQYRQTSCWKTGYRVTSQFKTAAGPQQHFIHLAYANGNREKGCEPENSTVSFKIDIRRWIPPQTEFSSYLFGEYVQSIAVFDKERMPLTLSSLASSVPREKRFEHLMFIYTYPEDRRQRVRYVCCFSLTGFLMRTIDRTVVIMCAAFSDGDEGRPVLLCGAAVRRPPVPVLSCLLCHVDVQCSPRYRGHCSMFGSRRSL